MKGKPGVDVFFSEYTFLQIQIVWGKVVGFFNDGVPAMVGKRSDVAEKIKNKVIEFEGLPLSLASTLMSGGYVEDLLCKYFLIY
jgi:hypothetical protein